MKKVLLFSILAFLASIAFAETPDALNAGAKAAKVDGSVTTGEYAWTKTIGSVSISASLAADGLVYVAIQAPTAGWVALGFGSLHMDKAKIAMAFDDNGKPSFTEQVGTGHRHEGAKQPLVKSWSVKTVGDTTTLELSIPKDAIIADSKLELIWAYGAKKNFSSYHQKKGWLTLAIK